MSLHKSFTNYEKQQLALHKIRFDRPSQIADAFVLGMRLKPQPTIVEFFADDEVKKMIEKTKCDVVTIASLKKFGGLE